MINYLVIGGEGLFDDATKRWRDAAVEFFERHQLRLVDPRKGIWQSLRYPGGAFQVTPKGVAFAALDSPVFQPISRKILYADLSRMMIRLKGMVEDFANAKNALQKVSQSSELQPYLVSAEDDKVIFRIPGGPVHGIVEVEVGFSTVQSMTSGYISTGIGMSVMISSDVVAKGRWALPSGDNTHFPIKSALSLFQREHASGNKPVQFPPDFHINKVGSTAPTRQAAKPLAKFEKGVPADPTKNMDPADAKVWKEMNEEYGDMLKEAAQGWGFHPIKGKKGQWKWRHMFTENLRITAIAVAKGGDINNLEVTVKGPGLPPKVLFQGGLVTVSEAMDDFEMNLNAIIDGIKFVQAANGGKLEESGYLAIRDPFGRNEWDMASISVDYDGNKPVVSWNWVPEEGRSAMGEAKDVKTAVEALNRAAKAKPGLEAP